MTKERREKLIQQHKCTVCGKPLPEGHNHTYCPVCLAKARERMHNLYLTRKELNLCRRCGSNKRHRGSCYCFPCAVKNAEDARLRRERAKNAVTM